MTKETTRETIKRSIRELNGAPTPHELIDDTARPIKNKTDHWGYHLILDIGECNKNVDDEDQIKVFIKDLVSQLDMVAVNEPMIVRFPVTPSKEHEEGRGISAMQMITTSSITLHGDDQNLCAYIDVFSCKTFDPKVAIDLVNEYFQPKHMGKFFLYRDAGNYPEK